VNAFASKARFAASRSGIAAFFDLDGTLLPLPSLERRFFRTLRTRRAIPLGNCWLWLAQAVRLAPNGIAAVAHANKTYLRGVSVDHRADALPVFFPAAIDRIAWHATNGHAIVLVTGTLAPLASQAALALTLRLVARGITTAIAVCATQLEQANRHWTGRTTGEPLFGEAKARVVRRFAGECGFDLSQCYAYGDRTYDRWMLNAVGRATAVNPSRELERFARLRNWPIFLWKETLAQRADGTASARPSGVACKAVPNIKSESPG
jgi:phosphoserine phosphatase